MDRRKAYAVDYLAGTAGHNDFIARICNDLNSDMRHAIAHLILARWSEPTYQTMDNKHFARIPHRIINKLGPKGWWQRLQDAGYLETKGYRVATDGGDSVCRGYRLTDEFMTMYDEAGINIAEDDYQTYNVVTGAKTTRRMKTQLVDHNGRPWYDETNHPCQRALKILSQSQCRFDRPSLLAEIKAMRQELKSSPNDTDKKRLLVAQRCVGTILTGSAGTNRYIPALAVTSTGRMQEIGGGLQGAPGRLKWAAWNNLIDNKDVYNYDLDAAQARIYLKIAGAMNSGEIYKARTGKIAEKQIDLMLLRKFCDNESTLDRKLKKMYGDNADNLNFRDYVYAKMTEAGAPEDKVKQIFYGVLMGLSTKDNPKKNTGLAQYVECPLARTQVRLSLKWLTKITDEVNGRLSSMLRRASRSGSYYKQPLGKVDHLLRIIPTPKGVYVKNAASMTALVMDRNGNWLSDDNGKWHPGRVWAHVLQGAESRYIAEIICRSEEGGFIPMSHQHDGLTTAGKIPRKIMDEAARACGLGNAAVLRLKPFKRIVKISDPNLAEKYAALAGKETKDEHGLDKEITLFSRGTFPCSRTKIRGDYDRVASEGEKSSVENHGKSDPGGGGRQEAYQLQTFGKGYPGRLAENLRGDTKSRIGTGWVET